MQEAGLYGKWQFYRDPKNLKLTTKYFNNYDYEKPKK